MSVSLGPPKSSKPILTPGYELRPCLIKLIRDQSFSGEGNIKRLTPTKLEPRSDNCIFVGYPRETKGYYFYNYQENKVFVAQKMVFFEKEFLSKGVSGSTVQLKEVRETQENVPVSTDEEVQQDESTMVDDQHAEP